MNRQQLHSSTIRCLFTKGEWGWTLNMMLLEATEKRKRRIIAKHVAMRLSFTITTTNFWRPDMNDVGWACARRSPFPQLFRLSHSLSSRSKSVIIRLTFSTPQPGKTSRGKSPALVDLLSSRQHHRIVCATTLVHYRSDFHTLNINLRVMSCT